MSVLIWLAAMALATAPVEPEADPETAEPCEDCLEEAAPSGPDRSAPPEVFDADWLEHAEPEIYDLGPGQKAYFVHVEGVRKVEIEVVMQAGAYEMYGEWTELGRGITNYMDTATQAHDAAALEVLGDLHEISLSSWSGSHNGGVDLSVPLEALPLGLELLREMLVTPAYPQKDVSRYMREKKLYYTYTAASSLGGVANSALHYSWFPADHMYGHRPDIDAMQLKTTDLLSAHQDWMTSGPLTVLVVGDVDWDDVKPLIEKAVAGLGVDKDRSERLSVPDPTGDVWLAVDMPGQKQSALRLRMLAPIADSEDDEVFGATSWALGGHFLSRLNSNLREDKGFTYGASAHHFAGKSYGYEGLQVDVKVENTAAAIREIEHELNRLVEEGVAANELDMVRRNRISNWNGVRETAGSATGFYSRLVSDEKTVADRVAENASVVDITPERTKAVAEKWISPDSPRVWVVVGDRSQLESQFETLGWQVQWITAQQAVLGVW